MSQHHVVLMESHSVGKSQARVEEVGQALLWLVNDETGAGLKARRLHRGPVEAYEEVSHPPLTTCMHPAQCQHNSGHQHLVWMLTDSWLLCSTSSCRRIAWC